MRGELGRSASRGIPRLERFVNVFGRTGRPGNDCGSVALRLRRSLVLMKKASVLLPVLLAAAIACGHDGVEKRDQQNYDVVEEGAANGITSTISGPGEVLPPITNTNADTTTAFTIDPNTATGTPAMPPPMASSMPSAVPPAYPVPVSTPPPPKTVVTPPHPAAPVAQTTTHAEEPEPEPAPPATDTSVTPPTDTGAATATTTSAPPKDEAPPQQAQPQPEPKKDEEPEEPPPPPPTATDTRGQ